MDIELIKRFLTDECGYESIEDAIRNTPRINIYAFVGEVAKDSNQIKSEYKKYKGWLIWKLL